MALIGPLLVGGGAVLSNILGNEAQRDASIEGAESALAAGRQGQAFAQEVLDASIARQQPFIDAGTAALPLATLAAQGGQGFRDTPIFRQREELGLAELMDAIQGGQLSGFAQDRFAGGLEASEEAQNQARLNDLLAIGLGSSGVAGQQGGTLANLATRTALNSGNIGAAGAQTAFEQRQNAVNQALSQLSSFPSIVAASSGGGGVNPFISDLNPLGLTPGQGL